MTESGLENRIKNVISIVFDVPLDSVTLQTSNKNIRNWDSLNLINLMIALESEFGVTLDVDEVVDLLSVEKIVEVLRAKGIS
jgi:acyl carrier protein